MSVKLCPELSLTLLKRLEAATSRLEDMVPNMGDQSAATNGLSAADQDSQAPEGVKQLGASDAPPSPVPLPPAIDDFDAVINGDVNKFVTMSEHIGGLVAEQVSIQNTGLFVKIQFLKPVSSRPLYSEPSLLSANFSSLPQNRGSPICRPRYTWRY